MALSLLERTVHYPESDGKPLGETGFHVEELFRLYGLLRQHFRNDAATYVGSNLFLYYAEGDPRRVVCPDLFVARGVAAGQRRIYKLWQEAQPPCCVFELTSDSTWREDVSRKKDLYARIGVEEYFVFDLLEECPESPLQAWTLRQGRYVPILPQSDGSWISRTLGLALRPSGRHLNLSDTATGLPLLDLQEVSAALEAETAARRALEEKLRRLETGS